MLVLRHVMPSSVLMTYVLCTHRIPLSRLLYADRLADLPVGSHSLLASQTIVYRAWSLFRLLFKKYIYITRCLLSYSVAATGEHVLPLSVVKLGFVLRGHEFLVDHPDESVGTSFEDQEEARYDELKGTLGLLISHVGS